MNGTVLALDIELMGVIANLKQIQGDFTGEVVFNQ